MKHTHDCICGEWTCERDITEGYSVQGSVAPHLPELRRQHSFARDGRGYPANDRLFRRGGGDGGYAIQVSMPRRYTITEAAERCFIRNPPPVGWLRAKHAGKVEGKFMKTLILLLLWATVASAAQAPPPGVPLHSPGVFKQNQQNCITVNPVMPQCVGFLVEQMGAAKRSEIEIKTKDVTGAVIKPPCSRYLFEAKGTSYTIRCEP